MPSAVSGIYTIHTANKRHKKNIKKSASPTTSSPPKQGDHIGYTLGINFFRAAMGTERHLLGGEKAASSNETGHTAGSRETSGGADENDDDNQAISGTGAWAKAGVDCELLVAGSYLHAHRVVLASRSPVLRDMIAQVRQDRGTESAHEEHARAVWPSAEFVFFPRNGDEGCPLSGLVLPVRCGHYTPFLIGMREFCSQQIVGALFGDTIHVRMIYPVGGVSQVRPKMNSAPRLLHIDD